MVAAVEGRGLECIELRRGASMSFTWSPPRLQAIHKGRTARTHPVSSVPDFWISILLTLSFFLRWVSGHFKNKAKLTNFPFWVLVAFDFDELVL